MMIEAEIDLTDLARRLSEKVSSSELIEFIMEIVDWEDSCNFATDLHFELTELINSRWNDRD